MNMKRHFPLMVFTCFVISQIVETNSIRLVAQPLIRPKFSMRGPQRTELPTFSVYEKLVDSMLDFSISSYGQLSRNRGYRENIVFSPFSLYTILLMTHLGARGSTAQQICHTLKICQYKMFQVHEAFGRVVKDLLGDKILEDSLAISNSLFVQRGMNVSRFYGYALHHIYNSTLKETDFNGQHSNDTNTTAPIDDINSWVRRQTKGKIPVLLQKPPSAMTRILMVNAVYFRSDWKYQFDPRSTEPNGHFFVTPHLRVQVPMMTSEMTLAMGHSPLLSASVLELPFSNSRISMFLCLPDTVDGLERFQRSFNHSSLKHLISTMRKTNVTVRIPKFSVDQTPSSISQVLWTLGIRDLFSPGDADLTGISESESLHVGNIVHRAAVHVDEKGSVASAATATVVERIGSASGAYFEANHPFMFLLMDKRSGVVIFMGRVAGF